MSKNFNIQQTILNELPEKVFFVTDELELLYGNQKYTTKMEEVHKLIERLEKGKSVNLDSSELISSIELYELRESEKIYLVLYKDSEQLTEELVTRKEVIDSGYEGILFVHRQVVIGHSEKNKLQKMIRANELIFEIRDIVDYVDDINEMFSYLLSKIHTVIPDADRSCILKIDDKDNLYLDTSYGFKDEYIEEFSIPFKESFAFMHMGNDFTKSVIINDVQKRYSDLFPDLGDDSDGYKIESNVTTPIVVDGNFYGIVSIDSDSNNIFDEVDLNLLDFIKIQLEQAIVKFQQYKIIKTDSNIDSLSGVSNRRHLLEILPKYQERADRENKWFLFVIFDLDQLKGINDTFGHVCGDRIIQEFSGSLKGSIRSTDFLARIGGDEFVGLFYGIDQEVLDNRLEIWKKYFMDNPLHCKDQDIPVKFSYGTSRYPEEGKHFSTLLELADKRMYIHKRTKN